MKYSLYSKKVVLGDSVNEATIFIEDGFIVKIKEGPLSQAGDDHYDFGDRVIMAGIIDPHVHVNQPGRTDWEGFDTATQAAAAGGITTIVDMPLNSSPVTTSPESFRLKVESAQNSMHVNCGFWGGLIPNNAGEINPLLSSGVLGLKAFLVHSGIDDFPNINKSHLHKALPSIAQSGLPLLVHCELENTLLNNDESIKDPVKYIHYLKSRPKSWEDTAISLMIDMCRLYEVPIHIVHLSSSNSLHQISTAKLDGLPITVETCPHYLFFSSEDIPDGATEYKCAPPIREKMNCTNLKNAIKDNTIDWIASDHSPSPPRLKERSSGNFTKAWGGIAGLQFVLPASWTSLKGGDFDLVQLSKKLSWAAAKFLQLDDQRGRIRERYIADLVIWDPVASFVPSAADIFHRHKLSPYIGHFMQGVVNQTIVGGVPVFDRGNIIRRGCGKLLIRS